MTRIAALVAVLALLAAPASGVAQTATKPKPKPTSTQQDYYVVTLETIYVSS